MLECMKDSLAAIGFRSERNSFARASLRFGEIAEIQQVACAVARQHRSPFEIPRFGGNARRFVHDLECSLGPAGSKLQLREVAVYAPRLALGTQLREDCDCLFHARSR